MHWTGNNQEVGIQLPYTSTGTSVNDGESLYKTDQSDLLLVIVYVCARMFFVSNNTGHIQILANEQTEMFESEHNHHITYFKLLMAEN
jgi:hypothetical protein